MSLELSRISFSRTFSEFNGNVEYLIRTIISVYAFKSSYLKELPPYCLTVLILKH
ncbi:hypothetical protein SAMN02745246_01506 [Leeuwenhoekiella marinoflava DSM 3653]|uniref:Uncharacterized protein n=2 Tax=Leeuwenhoekiella marinoflava TaxID=988 RepID=A0A4Q0PNZ4_9FLAO|nr:hypothetical protein DSL99_1676 [Leeuwenhoekiella marinoflava]SHF02674.1 hypothetical protein SAMN02745246_01506 [Leeuwenhoekiella marinoflava DSM 3653]